MEGEISTPAEQNLLGRFEEIQKRLETDPEFSRRAMLKGLGAFIGLTAAQGVVALDILNERQYEQLLADANGICGMDLDAVCLARTDGLEVGLEQTAETTTSEVTTTTIAPTTTLPPTTVPPTTTTAAPQETLPPPPPPEARELPDAPPRNMPYEIYFKNADLFLSKLPTLEQNHAMFGGVLLDHVPEQLAFINELDKAIKLSADEYRTFAIDQRYNQAFGERSRINPLLFIWHWAVGEYADPQDLANKMTEWRSSVQLYANKDDGVYQMVPELYSLTGHARGHLNKVAVGMEVYTGEWGKERSCLFGYTPERVKNGIYAAVFALSNAKLPINEKTLLGHYAADLIFDNPYYDPYTGKFHEIPGAKPMSLRKTDPPQEFMKMVVAKAKALASELGIAV